MRATTATTTRTATRTIDLTSVERRAQFAPVAQLDVAVRLSPAPRRVREAAARERANTAFRATRRARLLRGAIDVLADAAMAGGTMVLANVSLRLELGLPSGPSGILLGVALIGAGAAVAFARRAHGSDTDPATSLMPQTVIVLDEQPRSVICLDLPAAAQHQVA